MVRDGSYGSDPLTRALESFKRIYKNMTIVILKVATFVIFAILIIDSLFNCINITLVCLYKGKKSRGSLRTVSIPSLVVFLWEEFPHTTHEKLCDQLLSVVTLKFLCSLKVFGLSRKGPSTLDPRSAVSDQLSPWIH